MTFNIYVPSYKRHDRIMTHNLLEYCTYVVRKSQHEQYRSAGVNVLAVDDEYIIGIPAVENWIIDNAPEDVICILDDDILHFTYRGEKNVTLGEKDKETITSELERLAQLTFDLNIGFCVTTTKASPQSYSREFSFFDVPGSVKIINRKKSTSRFNDIDFLNDVDFQLQELLKNRIVLVSNYFVDTHFIDTNVGGSNDIKSLAKYHAANEFMKNKWGKYYEKATATKVGRITIER